MILSMWATRGVVNRLPAFYIGNKILFEQQFLPNFTGYLTYEPIFSQNAISHESIIRQ